MSLQEEFNQTAQKIDKLTQKLKEMSSAEIPTKQYQELQKELERLNSKATTVGESIKKHIDLGKDTKSNAFRSMQYDAAKLENKMVDVQAKMEQMRANKTAFIDPTQTEVFKKTSAELAQAQAHATGLKAKMQQVVAEEERANVEAIKTPSKFQRMTGAVKKLHSWVKKTTTGTKRLGNGAKGANKGFSAILRTMKQMMLSMAVFQLLFKGIEFLKSGLQNLAVYSADYNKKMSELKSSTAQLKNAIAVAFQPIMSVAIPMLSSLINTLSSACNAVSRFFAILGGKSTYTKAIKQNKDYAASLDKVGSSSEDAKGSLAGFDDLNVLQDNSSSGGGGGASEGADGSGFQEVSVGTPDWISGIKAAIDEGDWYSVGALVAEKLNAAIASISFDGVGELLAGKVNNALQAINGFLQTFDFRSAGAKIGEFANELIFAIQNIDWDTAGQAFSAGWIGIFESISGFLQEVDWMALGTSLYEAIIGFITNIDWGGLATALFEFIGSALGGIGAFIGGVLLAAWEDIKTAWSQVILWWQEVAYEDGTFTMEGLLQGILDKFSDIGTWIVDHIFTPFINGFKNAFGIHSPSTVMRDMGTYIIEGLRNGMFGMWDKVKDIVTTFKTNIKTAFTNIRNIAISIFTAMKTRISGIFVGLWNVVKKVINSMLSGVEGMANGVINGINGMINALNSLSFSIPDWVPGLGGKSFGLSIGTIGTISIPRLANGGITTGSTLANIGEAGREAVLPLENNTGWMDDLAEKLASKMPSYRAGTMVLELDGRELARAELPYFDAEASRIGLSLIPT